MMLVFSLCLPCWCRAAALGAGRARNCVEELWINGKVSQQGWCASVAKQRPKAVLMRKYGIKHCLFRVVAKCFSDPSRTHLFLSSSGLLLGSRAPLVLKH